MMRVVTGPTTGFNLFRYTVAGLEALSGHLKQAGESNTPLITAVLYWTAVLKK
jgi:hypothetical protein